MLLPGLLWRGKSEGAGLTVRCFFGVACVVYVCERGAPSCSGGCRCAAHVRVDAV